MSPPVDLAEVLRLAAAGVFPAADGGFDRVAPWRAGVEGVVALTGHAYLAVAADVDDDRLAALRPDGLGGAHAPHVVTALAGRGWVDALDVLLVATGQGRDPTGLDLVPRPDLADHPRAVLARTLRDDVAVWGRPGPSESLVSVGRGVAGLLEVGVEAPDEDGSRLVADVVAAQPVDEPVLAACAPGNARSLRSLLRAGFRPLGSVQVYRPQR